MKNLKLNLCLGLMTALLLMVFSACNKENNLITPSSTLEAPEFLQLSNDFTTSTSVEQGILVFENLEDYRATLLALNQMTVLEQLLWEEEAGFYSMQRLFNDLMEEESQKGEVSHSTKYIDALESGLIREHEFGYDLNIFNPAYAPVLNEQGLVKVGNDIFQFTSSTLKIWKNGNLQELGTILQSSVSTQEIQIIPMVSGIEMLNERSAYIWTDNCEQGNEDARMLLSGIFFSDFVKPDLQEILLVKYYVNIKSQLKDEFGNWQYDNSAQINLQGTSHSIFEISNGSDVFNKHFSQDYSLQSISGNYYHIGEESGYHSLNPPLYFTQPAQLVSCDWRAKSLMSNGVLHQCQIIK